MLRRISALVRGSFAIVLFLVEYVVAIGPHIYLAEAYTFLRGCIVYRHLRPLARQEARERDRRLTAARWVTFWAQHLWWWIRPLLGIKFTLNIPQELFPPPPKTFLISDNDTEEELNEQFNLVANHQSTLDAVLLPMVARLLGLHPIWSAKEELFGVPGIGYALRCMGAAKIGRRGGAQDRARMWTMARRAERYGLSTGLLPEGHRLGKNSTAERRIGKVHTNGHVAVNAGAPSYRQVVVVIDSTGALAKTMLDAHGWVGSSIQIDVWAYDSVAHLPPDEQAARLRAIFEEINALLVARHPQ